MRIYQLEANVSGEEHRFAKKFESRNDAIDYAFAYLEKQYIFGAELSEEYELESKHAIHYVLSNADSFTIRSFAA